MQAAMGEYLILGGALSFVSSEVGSFIMNATGSAIVVVSHTGEG